MADVTLPDLVVHWLEENYKPNKAWMKHTIDTGPGSGWRLYAWGCLIADIEDDHIQFYCPRNEVMRAHDPAFFKKVKKNIDESLDGNWNIEWNEDQNDFRFANPWPPFHNK